MLSYAESVQMLTYPVVMISADLSYQQNVLLVT